MNRLLISLVTCACLAAACFVQSEDEGAAAENSPEVRVLERPAATAPGSLVGPVLETMNSGGYTYVLIETREGEVWAAAPPTRVRVGQMVEIIDPMPMRGFESSSLDREFALIYFASAISAPDETELPTGSTTPPTDSGVDTGNVARAEGGQTVEEVITGGDTLVGKEVLVRGMVVKFTPQVMGKNWLHVQDGSGSPGTNDLTVTTATEAATGDVVLVRGVLSADRDFGFGYSYDLIIEDAKVTVE